VKLFTIRAIKLADLNTTLPLFEAQLREHQIVTSMKDLKEVARKVITDSGVGFILLATDDHNAAGFVYAAAHLSLEHGGIVGWVEELYVVPEKRGAGIGTCLLRETISRAKSLSWRALELEVVAGHERARAIYLRHAFQPISRTRFSLTLPKKT
jgi:GNAT superfamily N-acetyltransferase